MEKKNHKILIDPRELYAAEKFPMQKQQPPGLDSAMNPVPVDGSESYRGCGRLEGRKAFITGGDSGIGRAIAIAYGREGAAVAINYLEQEQSDADSLSELFNRDGRTLFQVPGDFRGENNSRQLVERAADLLGGIDILVLNAAVQTASMDIADITERQVTDTFETNVYGPIFMSKKAVEIMPPGSSIIFTASAEYFAPNKMLLDYAASKFAVVGFCRALSKQVLSKGIRVNAVCPGPVWTPLEVSGGNPDEQIPMHGIDTPFGRPGQPVEMAGVYVFLASNEATYISGEIYGATGGLSA